MYIQILGFKMGIKMIIFYNELYMLLLLVILKILNSMPCRRDAPSRRRRLLRISCTQQRTVVAEPDYVYRKCMHDVHAYMYWFGTTRKRG